MMSFLRSASLSLPRAKSRGSGGGLFAQTGVAVDNLVVTAGSPTTVTFDVNWTGIHEPGFVWSDTVWVFVDYNDAGTMRRLELTGASLTTSSAPATISRPNNLGAWVVGNARQAQTKNFSATVQLFTNADVNLACAYAINYPPVGRYTAIDKMTFTGTPPFYLTYTTGSTATVTREQAREYPLAGTLLSFTDATRAPGTVTCALPAPQTLQASATTYCAGSAVTLSLANTESGAVYQLYKNGSLLPGVTVSTASGGAATFSGSFRQGAYTVQTVAGAFCPVAVTAPLTIHEQALPTTPTVATTAAATVCAGTNVVFYVSNVQAGASYTWTGGGAVGGTGNCSYTFSNASGGLKSVTAQATYTPSGGVQCVSGVSTAKSVYVQALPTTPTVATAAAATVCAATNVV
jgi:hypothetical protein